MPAVLFLYISNSLQYLLEKDLKKKEKERKMKERKRKIEKRNENKAGVQDLWLTQPKAVNREDKRSRR